MPATVGTPSYPGSLQQCLTKSKTGIQNALDTYLHSYLLKRGYSKTARALSKELTPFRGLSPDRASPCGLLFEIFQVLHPVLAAHTNGNADFHVPTPAELLDLINCHEDVYRDANEHPPSCPAQHALLETDGSLGVSPELLRLDILDNVASLQGHHSTRCPSSPPQWTWPWCDDQGPSPWKAYQLKAESPFQDGSPCLEAHRRESLKRAAGAVALPEIDETMEYAPAAGPARKIAKKAPAAGRRRGKANPENSADAAVPSPKSQAKGGKKRAPRGGAAANKDPATASTKQGQQRTAKDGRAQSPDSAPSAEPRAVPAERRGSPLNPLDLLMLDLPSSVDSGVAGDLSNLTSTTVDAVNAARWFASANSQEAWLTAEEADMFAKICSGNTDLQCLGPSSPGGVQPARWQEVPKVYGSEASLGSAPTYNMQCHAQQPSNDFECVSDAFRGHATANVDFWDDSAPRLVNELDPPVTYHEHTSGSLSVAGPTDCYVDLNLLAQEQHHSQEAHPSLSRWTQRDTSDIQTLMSQLGAHGIEALTAHGQNAMTHVPPQLCDFQSSNLSELEQRQQQLQQPQTTSQCDSFGVLRQDLAEVGLQSGGQRDEAMTQAQLIYAGQSQPRGEHDFAHQYEFQAPHGRSPDDPARSDPARQMPAAVAQIDSDSHASSSPLQSFTDTTGQSGKAYSSLRPSFTMSTATEASAPSTQRSDTRADDQDASVAADFKARVENSCHAQIEAMRQIGSWYRLHETPSPRTSRSSVSAATMDSSLRRGSALNPDVATLRNARGSAEGRGAERQPRQEQQQQQRDGTLDDEDHAPGEEDAAGEADDSDGSQS
ncbi:unnamed protein product [Parajaminaea phylloscopi]